MSPLFDPTTTSGIHPRVSLSTAQRWARTFLWRCGNTTVENTIRLSLEESWHERWAATCWNDATVESDLRVLVVKRQVAQECEESVDISVKQWAGGRKQKAASWSSPSCSWRGPPEGEIEGSWTSRTHPNLFLMSIFSLNPEKHKWNKSWLVKCFLII